MVYEKLTEEFIDKHYFVLDTAYSCEKYDDNGFLTEEWMDFEAGSEWEITDDSYIGGDIHLDGLSLPAWIEMPEENFRKLFSAYEWIRRNDKHVL